MEECKTVTSEVESLDSLYMKQKEDVAAMRASLLACNVNSNANAASTAIRKITVMRFYHQLSRIIRYTELMDRIEEKLYNSIECAMDRMDDNSMSTWMTLLSIQERLQKSMIESQKLLQPYLELETLKFTEIPADVKPEDSFTNLLIAQESRDKIRNSAQAVLDALQSPSTQYVGEDDEDSE